MFGTSTNDALSLYLGEFKKFQENNKSTASVDLPKAQNAADLLAKTNEEKNETKADDNAALALINSKVTYENPERADKELQISADGATLSYRGETQDALNFITIPKSIVVSNK